MLFHSKEFLIFFLPITWMVFVLFVRAERYRGALGWITAASLVFYGWWNPSYLWLILASIAVNYSIGCLLRPDARVPSARRRAILIFGLAINLGALAYYKYVNFFVDNINAVFNTGFVFDRVVLPLAISFFTFQQIVFLVQSYKGELKEVGLLEYAFAVTFFPHLVAGPIVQYHELLPQLRREHWRPLRWLNLQAGVTLFVIGLFKKMVLGDGSGIYANAVFPALEEGQVFSLENAWVGALGYTFQIYFDFSGYSDMAIGLARCFGIRLPMNFAAPYRATSIIEFWRRWHITLSRFLRDYLYIPLGGGRAGMLLRYRNLLATMLLGGLWHGAGWTFLAWGGLHGIYLVCNHLFRESTGSLKRHFERLSILPPIAKVAAWVLTMLAVVVAWVFFRAESFGSAVSLLQSMFAVQPSQPSMLSYDTVKLLSGSSAYAWLGLMLAIALLMPTSQAYLVKFDLATDRQEIISKGVCRIEWRPSLVHGLLLGVICFLVVRSFFATTPKEFLYFNF